MKGMTLIWSKRFMILQPLPVRRENLDFSQQAVINHDRRDGDQQAGSSCLERQRKAGHDRGRLDVAALADIIEGDQDAENGAEEPDIGRVSANSRNPGQVACQCNAECIGVIEIPEPDAPEVDQALEGKPDHQETHETEDPEDEVVEPGSQEIDHGLRTLLSA